MNRTNDSNSNPAFTLTQRTLFGLLAHTIFGVAFTPEPGVDWVDVFHESIAQAVPLSAFYKSHEYELPVGLSEKLKPVMRQYIMRNTRIHAQHTQLHRMLTKANIPYCILKGAASAYYYPNPLLRGMGDVDFYVDAADVERTKALLIEHGFSVEEHDSDYHIVLLHEKSKYELHYEIPGVPKGSMGNLIRAYRADIREAGQYHETDLSRCVCPSPFHHGLILLLHMQQHLLTEGIGLRHLCDWAVFADSFTDEEIEQLFGERFRNAGLWRFARIVSLAATIAVGMPKRAWMGASKDEAEIAERLLVDLLSGGNFGSKDPNRERVYESMLISNQNKNADDEERGRIRNGLSSVNRWVRQRWPIAAKCPLILPFGWIYFLIRRFVLVVTGRKQRINLKKAMRKSQQRQELYRSLGLFRAE